MIRAFLVWCFDVSLVFLRTTHRLFEEVCQGFDVMPKGTQRPQMYGNVNLHHPEAVFLYLQQAHA